MRYAAIGVRTEERYFSSLPEDPNTWDQSIYGNIREEIPNDIPKPLGKFVVTTHYKDSNLFYDIITGKYVTGILHIINKTPFDWYSKNQARCETANYGSEFVAAPMCLEQIMDIRNILRYLGVPLREKLFMFGDNKLVVNSASVPHAKFHKHHNTLSFYRIRGAITAGVISFRFLVEKDNPVDILSKH
jgi:hypothetical protein